MLSDERVIEIERRLLAGETLRAVAAEARVGLSTVRRISAGERPRRSTPAGEDRKRAARRAPRRPSSSAATIWCAPCRRFVVPVNGECHLCAVRRLKYGGARAA